MNPIQAQAAKLWDLLFSPATGETYKKALLLTWDILKESARLVWLVICIGFVLVDWARASSVKSGQELRQWYDNIEEPKVSNLWKEAGQALLSVTENTAGYVMTQARTELGLPEPLTPVKLIPAAEPEPKSAKVESVKPATIVAPAAEPVAPVADAEEP